MRKAIALAIAAAAISATAVALLQALTTQAADVRIAVEFNDHSAAFWVALDLGYFDEEGVRVSYRVFSTGLELAAAIKAGDVDMAIACLGPIMVIEDKGYSIRLVEMLHNHGYSLIARPGINSVEELRGATISATGPGSPTWLLLHIINERYHLNATIKRMKPQIAINALIKGEIDAAVLPEHYATLATQKGANRILTSQEIWPDMPGSGLVVTNSFLKQHPDIVKKIAKALQKATQYINQHPDQAAAIVAKHLGTDTQTMKQSMTYLQYTTQTNQQQILKYAQLLHKYDAIEHQAEIIVKNLLGSAFYLRQ